MTAQRRTNDSDLYLKIWKHQCVATCFIQRRASVLCIGWFLLIVGSYSTTSTTNYGMPQTWTTNWKTEKILISTQLNNSNFDLVLVHCTRNCNTVQQLQELSTYTSWNTAAHHQSTSTTISCNSKTDLTSIQKNPWPQSASELYWLSDRCLSAKLVPTFGG
jgi:hypothetical protein